jgi:hypothetical protein
VVWINEQLDGEVTARLVVTVKCAVQSDHRKLVVQEQ